MMAITPAIAPNIAPTCGIVILARTHLQGEEKKHKNTEYLYNNEYSGDQ